MYTPLMLLAVTGLLFMGGKFKEWLWPTLITMSITIYVTFSWWCWWYGGGLSARPLVEFYVVMSLPLAAFFAYVIKSNMLIKTLTTIVVVFFLWLNLYQHEQYRSSLLHWDSMSKAAYWGIWGRQSWPENYAKMIVQPNIEKAKKGEDSYP